MSADDERAEQALRTAMAERDVPPAPDPASIRRRVRDRRVGITAVVAALVLLATAGGVFISTFRPPDQGVVAVPSQSPSAQARLPGDSAPSGWRTEYYRDISFEVPEAWGHTYAPASDWCVASRDGQPEPRHRKPYVSLGREAIVLSIACPDEPASLATEHVQVYELAPNEDQVRGERKRGEFWILPRFVSGLLLVVTSKDEALARRIADSIEVRPEAAPCDPDHQLATPGPARPKPAFDVAAVKDVGSMVICQYENGEQDAQRGLRAVVRLTPDRARTVVDAIAAAPVMQPRPCQTPVRRDVALLIRFEADAVLRELYLQAGQCADAATAYGGFDDGTNVRTLTKAGCGAVLISPAELSGASRYVGNACLG
jgi:hypothetical protein